MSNGVVIPIAPQSKASTVRYKAELRKALRRNAGAHDVNFLNITAMLDIMTIILVFLLKTLGESSASVPQSKDLMLPKSIIQTQPAQEGVRVTISKTQVLVGDDKVLDIPYQYTDFRSEATRGARGSIFGEPGSAGTPD